MNKEDIKIGQRVKSLRDFCDVPAGTEGIIDELYDLERENDQGVIEERFTGFMVAWNLDKYPLPPNYKEYDGKPAFARGALLRDGFDVEKELQYLEIVK